MAVEAVYEAKCSENHRTWRRPVASVENEEIPSGHVSKWIPEELFSEPA
jgi:hypothetical protein